ncbi:hypothetical protein B0T22DRAFT_445173 [Podospora appendiculata]|uniref:Uncharacterized protein n=1 Tax=Podospora appendiculata TaxID=314037 RepID=A0AAE1C7F2_9PEZI|nr:hypothetical protein B0T22DRAFT_445173 [Podospora appendiculata]
MISITTAVAFAVVLASLAGASFIGAEKFFLDVLNIRPVCAVHTLWIYGVDDVPTTVGDGVLASALHNLSLPEANSSFSSAVADDFATPAMPITSHHSTGMVQVFNTIAPSTSTTSATPPLETGTTWTDWMCCNLNCDICYSGADCEIANKNADCDDDPVTRDYPICCKVRHWQNGEKEKITKPDGNTEVSLVYS